MELLKLHTSEITKEMITELAEQLSSPCLDTGEITALELFVRLRAAKDAIDQSIAKIENALTEEISRYGKETPTVGKWQISHVNGGFTYDYTHYEPYAKLKEEMKSMEDKMKAASKLGGQILDEVTGELIPPAIAKPKKDSIKLTYKK